MAVPSAKRPVRRIKKAANAPIPSGPMGGSTCGHDGCERACKVRYCGPTTPVHNHHIVTAARGAAHVWAAAIVAGLAVVLTGSIAYTAVQAETQDPTTLILLSLRRIEMRLDRMEPQLKRLVDQASAPKPVILAPVSTSTSMEAGSAKAACMQKCSASASADPRTLQACVNRECPDLMRTPSSTERMREGDAVLPATSTQ